MTRRTPRDAVLAQDYTSSAAPAVVVMREARPGALPAWTRWWRPGRPATAPTARGIAHLPRPRPILGAIGNRRGFPPSRCRTDSARADWPKPAVHGARVGGRACAAAARAWQATTPTGTSATPADRLTPPFGCGGLLSRLTLVMSPSIPTLRVTPVQRARVGWGVAGRQRSSLVSVLYCRRRVPRSRLVPVRGLNRSTAACCGADGAAALPTAEPQGYLVCARSSATRTSCSRR